MATVDPAKIYWYLVKNHQVSGAVAQGILANIRAESSFSTTAVGDGGTSGGLFQHHAGRWTSLKAYAKSTGRAWDDWTAQVDFAIKEARGMGINLGATDPVAASKEWTIKFERPADMHRKAGERAAYVNQYNFSGSTPVATSPGTGNAQTNSASQEALNIPTGGSWYLDGKGGWVIVYPVTTNGGAKAYTYYRSSTAPPSGTQVHRAAGFNERKGGYVDGGTVDSFRGVPAGKSYQDLVDDVLMKWGLAGTDAVKDQGIMSIVALGITRELSSAELANRLRQTKWYQSRTDKEREWNDLSQAEKDQRIVDEASKLASMWFTYVGEDMAIHSFDRDGDGLISVAEIKKGDKDLFKWAQNLASGKATQAQAVNSWMKEVAGENPESPWSRTVREEEQAQGQFGVDLANMEGQLRQMYQDWGVKISDQTLEQMAQRVIMNDLAIEDVEKDLDTQARGLYQSKPPGMTTREWAEPYFQTYMGTLEVNEPDIFDPLVQRGMAEGQNLADFQKLLRADQRWLNTNNARVEMNDKVSALGRQMGFN